MDRKKEFREMLDMQQATNNQVDSDWVKKKREWYRAVWIECGELMEHYGHPQQGGALVTKHTLRRGADVRFD